MSAQTKPITERQLDLITRAHCDAGGLIEPLLSLKGGAKLKMIASLAIRGLIKQVQGQWCITPGAIAIVTGSSQTQDAVATTDVLATTDAAEGVTTPLAPQTPQAPQAPLADDPELEAAVCAVEDAARAQAKVPRARDNSKQATVISMLKRPEGVTIAQIMDVTGWQAHTVRGTFAGAFKKKLGLSITSDKVQGGERIYHAAA